MDFLDLAKQRCSVRSFIDEEVPDEVISRIIEAGMVAPTACNNQPIRIVVLKSEEALEKLKLCTKYHFQARIAFIICYKEDECWKRSYDQKSSGDIDASIVASHMMLEAQDEGIGSTWVMSFDPDIVKKEYELEEGLEPVCILPMGYPSKDYEPSSKHFEKKTPDQILIVK